GATTTAPTVNISGGTDVRVCVYNEIIPVTDPLTVTKTATPTWTKTVDWDITKTVDPAVHNLIQGQTGTSTYTIERTKEETFASSVTGTITITNPAGNTEDATVETVKDTFAGQTIDATCPGGLPAVLDPGESLECSYTIDTGASPQDGTNTATVTTSGDVAGNTGQAPVDFPDTPTLTGDSEPDSVTVTDDGDHRDEETFGPFS